MLKNLLVLSFCVLYLISHNECQKTTSNSNRINRMRGSIITNLTRTHAYDDDIVTSHLDASIRIRQFYRMFRDVYNKYERNEHNVHSKKKLKFVVWNSCAFICEYSLLGGTGQRQSGKFLQQRVPNNLPFPCKTRGFRSKTVPQSVHQLRPGLKRKIYFVVAFGLLLLNNPEPYCLTNF